MRWSVPTLTYFDSYDICTHFKIQKGQKGRPSYYLKKNSNGKPIDVRKLKINLTKKIGSGSFANVYSGNIVTNNGYKNIEVAVKVMYENEQTDELYNEMNINRYMKDSIGSCTAFLQCNSIVLNSKHNELTKMISLGNFNCLVFPLGKSLHKCLQDNEIILDHILFLQMLINLKDLHDNDIIHGDIKPGNMIFYKHLKGRGRIQFADFGNSVKLINGKTNHSGKCLTTSYFESIEQIKGTGFSKKCDIYALGVTFFYCLTKSYPFQSNESAKLRGLIFEVQDRIDKKLLSFENCSSYISLEKQAGNLRDEISKIKKHRSILSANFEKQKPLLYQNMLTSKEFEKLKEEYNEITLDDFKIEKIKSQIENTKIKQEKIIKRKLLTDEGYRDLKEEQSHIKNKLHKLRIEKRSIESIKKLLEGIYKINRSMGHLIKYMIHPSIDQRYDISQCIEYINSKFKRNK